MTHTFLALVVSALAITPLAAADFVPEGDAAHFRFAANESICFGPASAAPGESLVGSVCGDGSSNDSTAMFPVFGTGKPGQIAYGDWCITAAGASPSSDVTIVDCSDDPAQVWTVNEDQTISNADDNCITFGRAAIGPPTTLSPCNAELRHLQLWNPLPVEQ
ncbi:hypothetical protein OF83DRAFT_341462 [Amylostereum chailletii]|nr:hypothetical protein OF83DRAFT_341462 [Amylostereum chailletii]